VERIREEMTKLLCGEQATEILLRYPAVFAVFLQTVGSILTAQTLGRGGNVNQYILSRFQIMFHKHSPFHMNYKKKRLLQPPVL
jgi:hypothetical protein